MKELKIIGTEMKRNVLNRWGMLYAFLFVSLLSFNWKAEACTSVIISGRVRSDGRPVMLKHRDTRELDNRLEWFHGEHFNFVALVNSNWESSPVAVNASNEAWSGMNSAGFCIMNTATYDLKDDDVPDSMMDREGEVMFRCLGICRTVSDFEHFLDTLARPMGVEANFGVIDASGGAAYYEVNNHSWVKFDVNSLEEGYMVVTNFTRTGRKADRRGEDRFRKASEIMEKIGPDASCSRILNSISRSGKPIVRKITSSSILFQGVRKGEDPFKAVMWTILGSPCCAPYIPVMVFDSDHIPWFLKGEEKSGKALFCDTALQIKAREGLEGDIPSCNKVENMVDRKFGSIYRRLDNGRLSHREFTKRYDMLADTIYIKYSARFLNK